MTQVTLGRRLIDLKMRWSRALCLPTDKTLWERWHQTTESEIRCLPDGSKVVDLGAGRRCIYAGALRSGVEPVAIDSSAEALGLNEHADVEIVADACNPLPVPPGSADLLDSRAVLEHAPDMRAAAEAMANVLRRGGRTVHIISARSSLCGIAAGCCRSNPFYGYCIESIRRPSITWVSTCSTTGRGRRRLSPPPRRRACARSTSRYPLFLVYALYKPVVRRLRLVGWPRIYSSRLSAKGSPPPSG